MLAYTIRFAKFKRMFNKLYFAAFKLLPKPLKLLLSHLCQFCQNHISYTSLITVTALNDLRWFCKHL